MTFTITRRHVVVVLVVLVVGIGAYLVARALGGGSPSTTNNLPSVMQCSGKTQSRPSTYVLSCADYNSGLYKIHWTTWSAQAATAKATYTFNTCVPYCAAGKSVSEPATVRLSVPVKTKSGLLFTRVTVAYGAPSGKKSSFSDSLPSAPLAASGSPTKPISTTTLPAPVGSGYLSTTSTSAAFIQWNSNGTQISGTLQYDYIVGTPPNEQLSTQTAPVTGQVNGSQISLSISGGTSQFGTTSGSTFTVNVPQSDGSLSPVTFAVGSATEFNDAVASLQSAIASANNAAQAAENVASAQQSIDNDAAAVEQDLAHVKTDEGSLSADVGSFAKNLASTQSDLTTTGSDEQSVIAESKNGTDPNQVCSDSDNVGSDADNVGSDGDNTSSTADNVQSDIGTIQQDLSTLQQGLSSMKAAQSQLPSYRDGAPTQSEVDQATASAQSAIAAAVKTANGFINQVNGMETQAYNDAVQAAKAGGCAGPASLQKQPTI